MDPQFAEYGILYVDDEVKSLKYFEAIFDQVAPIYTAESPEKGLELFRENHEHIGLVLSDKKMPNQSGIEFLEAVRECDPRPMRLLVTAYSDLNVAVDALNDGLLYSYLSKPWDPDELEHRLVRALRHFALARERDILIEEKSQALQHLVMADKAASIGILSSGLNHHLRNALMVMRTFHEMLPMQLRQELGREPNDPAFWSEFYGEVGAQMERMTSMLSRLSDGATSGDLRIEEDIDLGDLLRQAAQVTLDKRPDIDIVFHYPETPPTLAGDVQKLGQMTRMLFQEATSSLAAGGKIEVTLREEPEGGGIHTIFVDDGELVPEEDLDRLFDPFYVRPDKPEELGTNLMACYLTTYHHGGTIAARHTSDGRNAVDLHLPTEPKTEVHDAHYRAVFERSAEELSVSKACDTFLPA